MKCLYLILPIIIGFLLDLLIGDPYKMPHPVRLFGHLISTGERILNKGSNVIVKGAILSLVLYVFVWFSFYFLEQLSAYHAYTNIIFASIFIFYGLANRGLVNEVLKVNRTLTKSDLEAGRKQLSFIVGRDTSQLNETSVRKASLETLSENLSDGVIAPLFYLFVGGLPLMFTYKMVNTLDSMIGYKNERYKNFGFFAAKIDDAFNYLPSRITAFLIAMVSFKWRAFSFIFKYGRKHSSPNAGYPEAALAGALNCLFGGPSLYHGELVDKPYIGKKDRELNEKDVFYACGLNLKASVFFLLIGLTVKLLICRYM